MLFFIWRLVFHFKIIIFKRKLLYISNQSIIIFNYLIIYIQDFEHCSTSRVQSHYRLQINVLYYMYASTLQFCVHLDLLTNDSEQWHKFPECLRKIPLIIRIFVQYTFEQIYNRSVRCTVHQKVYWGLRTLRRGTTAPIASMGATGLVWSSTALLYFSIDLILQRRFCIQ